jgi:hypothetical protein
LILLNHKKTIFLFKGTNQNHKIAIDELLSWVKANSVAVLNVAGPRLSEWKGACQATKAITALLIDKTVNERISEA